MKIIFGAILLSLMSLVQAGEELSPSARKLICREIILDLGLEKSNMKDCLDGEWEVTTVENSPQGSYVNFEWMGSFSNYIKDENFCVGRVYLTNNRYHLNSLTCH